MIDLFLSNNMITVFSRKEKQNLNQSKHMNGISITRGSNILSIRSDNGAQITTLVNTNLKVIHY